MFNVFVKLEQNLGKNTHFWDEWDQGHVNADIWVRILEIRERSYQENSIQNVTETCLVFSKNFS